MTLAVLVAALSSMACSVHISTGPSAPGYSNGAKRPNGIVWASAPRQHREHRDPNPRDRSDREVPPAERPNRQFDAADELMADAAAHRTPRQLDPARGPGGTKDRGVVTVVTPSHTGRPQKPPRDIGQWVSIPVDGHRPSDGPSLGGGDSGGKSSVAARSSLPRNDGRLQRVAKQERDSNAQPAGPSEPH